MSEKYTYSGKFCLSWKMREELCQYAKRRSITMSEVIREAIEFYLGQELAQEVKELRGMVFSLTQEVAESKDVGLTTVDLMVHHDEKCEVYSRELEQTNLLLGRIRSVSEQTERHVTSLLEDLATLKDRLASVEDKLVEPKRKHAWHRG